MNRVDIEFTCDAAKAKRNLRIHKISFDPVAEAFAGLFVLIVEDCEDEFGEVRYDAIGRARSQSLLVVIFADRSSGQQRIIHIISARKAQAYEEAAYSDQF